MEKRKYKKRRLKKKYRKIVNNSLIVISIILIVVFGKFIFNAYTKFLINPSKINEVGNMELNHYDFNNLVEINGFKYYQNKDGKLSKLGIDVSKHQGEIDWEKVKASNIDFAIIRAGYRGYDNGELHVDKTFKYNIEKAIENDIAVGVYFFSQAINKEEAIEEADLVYKLSKKYDLLFPIVYDMEDFKDHSSRIDKLTNKERTDIALSFCQRIEQKGLGCMIYGNRYWLMDNFEIKRLANYPFWIAQYRDSLDFEYDLCMWQYSESGKVSGIEGNVDMNIYFVE